MGCQSSWKVIIFTDLGCPPQDCWLTSLPVSCKSLKVPKAQRTPQSAPRRTDFPPVDLYLLPFSPFHFPWSRPLPSSEPSCPEDWEDYVRLVIENYYYNGNVMPHSADFLPLIACLAFVSGLLSFELDFEPVIKSCSTLSAFTYRLGHWEKVTQNGKWSS